MMVVPHNRLTHGEAERAAVAEAVASGRWSCGPIVARLEDELAARVGRRHTAAVGSGLGALRLGLLSLGVHAGDEVVVPAYSCVALANAVLASGARPVPADVTPGRWTLDPAAAAAAIGPRTKAIIAVHTFGVSADTAALAALGPPLIEDCAHGIVIGGMGARARIAVTSFYATKLIGAGEGGAVLTDDDTIAAFVRRWRDYGDQAANATRLNDKMTELSAALARCQLARLDEFVAARRARAERYQRAFAELAGAGRLILPVAGERIWYRYAVEFADLAAADAIRHIERRGVHAAEPVSAWAEDRVQHCSVSTRAFQRIVSLPLYPTLAPAEQDAVIQAVRDLAKGAA
jgi:dTDP-4-amino-4,6-dideoxygalactose transaminase